MRFSASRLKTWQECQLQAKFKYIDSLPGGPQNAKGSFGTVMHHCIEFYNKTGNIEKAIEMFKDLWKNPEKLGVAPEVWPRMTTYDGLRDRGIAALQRLHEVAKWDERRVIACEHEFTVPFGEHELHGYIDCLEIRKSGKGKNLLRVVDYKVNTKRPNMAELGLDIQFTVYDYATRQPEMWESIPKGLELFKELEGMPRRNIWFHLWDGSELDAGGRDDDDFMRLYRLCDEIKRAYEAEVFVPRIGDACLFCPYTEPCGLSVPTKEELAEQEAAWI